MSLPQVEILTYWKDGRIPASLKQLHVISKGEKNLKLPILTLLFSVKEQKMGSPGI